MLLPIPAVGLEAGPQFAIDVNNCFTIVDQHNHEPGSGVQITPSGLNISSDLPFNDNNATLMRSIRFISQSAPLALASDLGCIYEVGADLYYNDGVGNQVRITQNGAVAGTPGSIANLAPPASASYSSATKTFIFQSDTTTPANLDGASIVLRNLVANSPGLTLSPPSGLGADYSLTLPTLPGTTNIVTLTASGTLGATLNVDNVTIQIASNNLQVKDAGITTVKIADANVTRPKLEAVGQQVSASSGFFSTTTASYVDIPNLSVTLTTTGRPVMLALQGDGSGNPSYIGGFNNAAGASARLQINFVRDTTVLVDHEIRSDSTGAGAQANLPPSSHNMLDVVAAGTYVYKAQIMNANGDTNTRVSFVKLVAYEL